MKYKFILFAVLFGSMAFRFPEMVELGTFTSAEDDVYLKASFSQEEHLNEVLKAGENASFAEAFDQKFKEDFDTSLQYENIKKVNVDEWELALFDKRNMQMSFLKNFESYEQLSEEFVDLVQANINYNYWHLLLAYSINNSNSNTGLKQVTSLPRIMTSDLDPQRINNPKRMLSKSYRAFLPYFVIYFNSEENNFKKYADGVLSMKDKAEYASKYLKGDVLDYTLTELIEKSHKTLSSSSFRYWTSQIYCQNLQNYLSDGFYSDVVKAETERAEKVVEVEKSKNGNLPAIMDLEDKAFTFEKYKGKVIYVDFWASWCGPCRKEFPASRAMHESLSSKQKKDIVFLYISIDEDLEKWRGAVEKLGLEEFGENGHSYEVSGRYQVSSIPRYMIIDKKGNLVNDKAPRPSSAETLPALLELL
ncbi:TlpA family protein disulfide reductase [Arcticibacterium luteifluviistationis]|uniref:Thioredoxin domain-containing protein n=1 Tax=Arcticibacterium luteifluviistationis TaxID=1784714 RepID=A0A2Z4G8M1_9BACT|nr:TlpA disulfide reductase family protein [Arcticibacterium luteifluviistationis]AWV97579.1 hypothetical protein DJ013_05125 [Arcticibacterium luteifluviistationis]